LPEPAVEGVLSSAEPDLDSTILSVVTVRGSYADEAQLLEWLEDRGAEFDAADVLAALDRLWEKGLIIRPEVNQGSRVRAAWVMVGMTRVGSSALPALGGAVAPL
jgi:hypothetical protein